MCINPEHDTYKAINKKNEEDIIYPQFCKIIFFCKMDSKEYCISSLTYS